MILDPRWGLDLPPTDAAGVQSLVALLAANGVEASAVDPRRWLTWHLDRSSVEGLRAALQAALTSGRLLDDRVIAGVESLLEDCDEWLAALD